MKALRHCIKDAAPVVEKLTHIIAISMANSPEQKAKSFSNLSQRTFNLYFHGCDLA